MKHPQKSTHNIAAYKQKYKQFRHMLNPTTNSLLQTQHTDQSLQHALNKFKAITINSNTSDTNRTISHTRHKHAAFHDLLNSYRLFENNKNKVEAYNQRHIQSRSFISRVEYQTKKIQLERQKISKKNFFQNKQKGKVRANEQTSTIRGDKSYTEDRNNDRTQNVFFSPLQDIDEFVQPKVMRRIKTTINASRKRIRGLYNQFTRQQQLGSNNKMYKSCIKLQAANNISGSFGENSSRLFTLQQTNPDITRTISQSIQHRKQQSLIQQANQIYEIQNKAKQQQIVFNQFKKIFYGYQKGRFIQENIFKTRLRGEKSQAYMRILSEQQKILQNFQGSTKNKKDMIQQFSEILGKIRSKTHAKLKQKHFLGQKNELQLMICSR